MAWGGALPAHRLRDHQDEEFPAPSLRAVKSCSGAVRHFKSSQVKSSANNRGTLVRRGRRELSSPALPATKSLISRMDTSPEILSVCRLVKLETSQWQLEHVCWKQSHFQNSKQVRQNSVKTLLPAYALLNIVFLRSFEKGRSGRDSFWTSNRLLQKYRRQQSIIVFGHNVVATSPGSIEAISRLHLSV